MLCSTTGPAGATDLCDVSGTRKTRLQEVEDIGEGDDEDRGEAVHAGLHLLPENRNQHLPEGAQLDSACGAPDSGPTLVG